MASLPSERFPSEVPIFYWDSRNDPSDTFRVLDSLIRDLHDRLLKVFDDHSDLLDGPLLLKSFTVSTLPSAVAIGLIFVTDETGGAVPAFSDGTDWRRTTDRAIVS